MNAFDFILPLFLVALAWLWYDGLGAREAAVAAARAACESEGLQFLDETVAGAGLRFVRADSGNLTLRRIYKFEYSDTGNNRRPGSVILLGHDVQVVNIGLRLVLH